jgi:hypothetical protein
MNSPSLSLQTSALFAREESPASGRAALSQARDLGFDREESADGGAQSRPYDCRKATATEAGPPLTSALEGKPDPLNAVSFPIA